MNLQLFGRHPVFRGFEALGIGPGELAHMIHAPEGTVRAWQRSGPRLSDPWAILLTEFLGAWLNTPPEPLHNHPGYDDLNHAEDREAARLAENWYELALESIRDLPEEEYTAARALRNGTDIAA